MGPGNSAETMLPVVATEALYGQDVSLEHVAMLLSTTPAKLFGLYPQKGAIAVGSDADLAIVETNGNRTLDARDLEYEGQTPWSPYDGRTLRVYPVYTVLRGQVIFAEGVVAAEPGLGRFLTRRLPSGGRDGSAGERDVASAAIATPLRTA
jgi:dihydroorotase-like cyclic amidohydrolase